MKIYFSSLISNERLDKFLSSIFNKFSRSFISKLINDKKILVNNKFVKPKYKVKKNDLIEIELIQPKKIDLIPQNIPIEILYEDKHIIVINKPANIVVHPSAGHFDNTIVNALLYHCNDLSSINNKIRPGIVHRLDKKTSGILIVAKDNESHLKLTEDFKNRRVKKFYKALLYGVLSEKKGTIESLIGRDRINRIKMSSNTSHGKVAITHFKVEKYIHKFTLVDVNIETGRTHQIRVHFSEKGFPVVGEDLYINRGILNKIEKHILAKIEKLNRYFLHSYKVIFSHPITGELIQLETDLPQELKEFIEFLENQSP